MANYFSIADGNFTEPGVFGRTLDSADVMYGTSLRPITPRIANIIPFYAEATSFPIYGVAVNLYSRGTDPTGTLNISLSNSTGVVFSEQYDINLFTQYGSTHNFITVHPQNWQILKLSSPVSLPTSDFYTLSINSTNLGEISLVGSDSGIDAANNTELDIAGIVTDNTPFATSNEQSLKGIALATFNPPEFGLDEEDFTVEGYFYFHSFPQEWSPLVNFGDGWGRGKFAAWGLSYNSANQRIYFWRYALSNPRRVLDQNFNIKHPLVTGRWYHIAASRANSKLSIWVDGVCVGIQTYNDTFYSAIRRQKLRINNFSKDGTLFASDMSVSNVRVTKGNSKYNPDFNLVVAPLSLRVNTPFLYQSPYTEIYLAADVSSPFIERPLDVDAAVFNTIDNARFTKNGSSSSSLSPITPLASPVSEFSLAFTGTSMYVSGDSYGNYPTGNFTVESWIYPERSDLTHVVCLYSSDFSTNNSFYVFGIEIHNNFLTGYVAAGAARYTVTDTTNVALNTWSHVALVRQNQTLTLYVNGVSVGNISIPNKINTTAKLPTMVIGGERNNTKNYVGLIYNLRFNQGIALYTSDFNVSSPADGVNISSPEPLSAINSFLPNIGSLTLQPLLYDAGTPADKYSFSVTLQSSIDSPFTSSAEQSIVFVRSQQDFITIPFTSKNIANIGDTDATIEAWIKMSSIPSSETYPNIYSLFSVDSPSSSNTGYSVWISQSKIYITGPSDSIKIAHYNHNMVADTWYHVACVRYKGDVTIYINGVATGAAEPFSVVGSSYSLNESTAIITLGSHAREGAYFDGKIINFRIIRGKALYTANFDTLPVLNGADILSPAPLTTVNNTTGKGIYYTRGVIYPSTYTPHAGVSRSSFFNGTASHSLYAPSINVGKADFTLEFWIDPVRDQTQGVIVDVPGTGGFRISVGDGGAADTKLVVYNLGKVFAQHTLDKGSWTHVALVRSDYTFYLYVHGNLIDSHRNTSLHVNTATETISIGGIYNSSSTSFTFYGYIADFRFVAGTAIYPAASFPTTLSTSPLQELPAASIVAPLYNVTTGAPSTSTPEYLFAPADSTFFWKIPTQDVRLPSSGEIGVKGTGSIPADTNWTLEFWVRPENTRIEDEEWINAYNPGNFIIGINPGYGSNKRGKTSSIGNDRRLYLYDSVKGIYQYSTDQCVRYRQWNYIAVIHNADTNTVSVYINGSLQLSYDRVAAASFGLLEIGPTTYGYIHSVHIRTNSNNTGVPVAAFTPASDTLFLAQSPFNTYTKASAGSAHFGRPPTPFVDGTGAPAGDSIAFSRHLNSRLRRKHISDKLRQDNSFTVEGWLYATEDSSLNNAILSIWKNNNAGNFLQLATQNMFLVLLINGDGEQLRSRTPLELHKWYYFAVCQDDTKNVRMYLSDNNDGVAAHLGTFTSTYSIAATHYNLSTYIGEGFAGYISNIRESQTALYTVDADVTYTYEAQNVTPNTISLIQHPYEENVYSYYESTASLLFKQNNTALTADSPFGVGVDGSISQSYAVIPADFNPDLNLGSKTFTLEWWDKINDFTNNFFPIIQLGSVTNTGDVLAVRYLKSGSTIKLILRCNGATDEIILPKDFIPGDWKHCALVRLDDYVNFYLNGAYVARAFIGQAEFNSIQNNSILGAFYNASTPTIGSLCTINGNISNIRLVLNQALYPGTVPAAPLDNIEGTAFLYKEPYNSQFLSNAAVGTVSLASVETPLVFDPSPSSSVSLEDCMIFNKKDFLKITDVGDDYDIGASNAPFTLELWVYALSNSGVQSIVSRGGGAATWGRFGYSYELQQNGDSLEWYGNIGNTSLKVTYPHFGKKCLRRWTHVAVTYDGSITRLHVNGIEQATYSLAHTYVYNLKNKFNFKLGDSQAYNNVFSPRRYFGYLSNVRIIKGTNLYDAASFSPEARLSAVPGTVLLLQSPYNNNVEFKFQSSPFGENVDDKLSFLDNTKFAKTAAAMPLMTEDFTIEFWFYCLREQYFNTSVPESVLDGRINGSSTTPFVVRFNQVPGKITVYVGSPITSTNETFITVGNIVPKTWSHFAIVRKNSTVNLYQDGILVGSFYHNGVWGGNQLLIGKQHAGLSFGANNFFGYLSNIRIVDRSAIYGNTYSLFGSPLTVESDTVFLQKIGANINKAIITTQSPSISEDIISTKLTDALDTSLKEGSPWSVLDRDYFALGYERFLRFGPDSSFDLSGASFTIEFWVMRLADIGCEKRNQGIFTIGNNALYVNCDNVIVYYNGNGGNATDVELPLNTWVHVALVCDLTKGEQLDLYINGEKNFSWFGSSKMFTSYGVKSLVIGTTITEYPREGDYVFNGNISNFRIVRTDIDKAVIDDAGNFAITTRGNFTITDSPDPALASSIYFNGNTYISSASRSCELPGQFTIEFYIKTDLSQVSSSGEEIAHNVGNWLIALSRSGVVTFHYVKTTSTSPILLSTPAGSITTNTWTHIAVVRTADNDINIYVNKLLLASTVEAASIGKTINKNFRMAYPGMKFSISGFKINNAECLYNSLFISPPFPLTKDNNNVIMMLRSNKLTNSLALPYSGNFTPPSSALSAIPGTVLLLKAPYNLDANNIQHYACSVNAQNNINPYTLSSAYSFSGRWDQSPSASTENPEFLLAYNDVSFTSTTAFTIRAWIKPSTLANQPHPARFYSGWYQPEYRRSYFANIRGWRTIMHKPGLLTVYLDPSNRIRVYANGKPWVSAITIPEQQWTHISIVCSGRRGFKLVFFINGVMRDVFHTTASTSSQDTNLFIGTTGVSRQASIWWNCFDPWLCTAHYGVSSPFYGLISDLQFDATQQFMTNLELESRFLSLASGTTFLYRSPYDVYYYETSSGNTNFVINNIIPDNDDGVFFPGDSTKYLKSQLLPAMPEDFLIEIWFKSTRSTIKRVPEILLDSRDSNALTPWYVMLSRSAQNSITFAFGRSIVETSANAFLQNVWQSIVIIRKQGTVVLYVGGIPVATIQSSISVPSRTLYVGRTWEGKLPYQGFVNSVRVVKDNTVYNTSFDPFTLPRPTHAASSLYTFTEPLFAGTSVTDTNNNVSNNACLRYPIGSSSSALIPVSPVNSTDNIFFFNYNQSMIIPHNSRMDIANVPWSFEVWVFLIGTPLRRMTIVRKGEGATHSYAIYCNTNRTLTLAANRAIVDPVTGVITSAPFTATASTGQIPLFKWTHLMFASDGIDTELFINGVFNFTYNYAPQTNNTLPLYVGNDEVGGHFTGYMSNLRLINNQNAFNTSIEVPNDQFPTNNTDDPHFDDVVLLLQGNGPDGSTNITDSSKFNTPITVNGNCKLRSIPNKFGGSSISFEAAGDSLSTTDPNLGKFDISDFTVEFWVFAQSAPQNDQTIISFNKLPSRFGFYIRYRTNKIEVCTGSTVIISSTNWSLNAWHYIAVSRTSGSLKLFINGNFIKSASFSNFCGDGLQFIGRNTLSTSFGLIGKLEEVRITKRVGRYNTDFTPPTSPVNIVFNTAVVLQAPYEQYTYGTYLIEGVHISSAIIGSVIEPRTITLTEDARVSNLYIHNKGTLNISKNLEAKLDIVGSAGLQITGEGSLNIN